MKKQITILILVFFNCLSAWSQRFVKTTTPCNDELLKKTPGRWLKPGTAFYAKVSQQQQKEIQTRLDAIHQLLFNIYPSPMALDAYWSGKTDDLEFGSQLKIVRSPNARIDGLEVNGTPTIYCNYFAKFCGYGCGRVPNEMRKGLTEDGTYMDVYINRLENCFLHKITDNPLIEAMRVDGRPIKLMPVRKGKWKGYDVYYPEQGSGLKTVLLHRQGMLPYIPVTRKQYLDRCIEYLPQFFDSMMKPSPWIIDKKEHDEQIKKMQKIKDDVLKHYKDELQATTSAGLLDSPAFIKVPIGNISTTEPIFITEVSGGTLLVTENPAYMKKDLPKDIPQFMVFTLEADPGAMEPYKAIDENFPIEKLQAMIDK
jgi:hypothetical protein